MGASWLEASAQAWRSVGLEGVVGFARPRGSMNPLEIQRIFGSINSLKKVLGLACSRPSRPMGEPPPAERMAQETNLQSCWPSYLGGQGERADEIRPMS